MTNRTSPVRRHSRFPVRWPVLYGCEEFLAEGTVLDLTHIGWRVTGSMPVTPGMQLTLQLCVPDKQNPVRIERATVLWVKDYEFAIEAREMASIDQAWVTEFLNGKLGLPWISGVADHRTLPQKIDADSRVDASVEHHQPARRDRAIHAFLSAHILMKDIEDEVIQRCMAQHGCHEEEARAAYQRFIREIWKPALRIVSGIMSQKSKREFSGEDSITNN